MENPNEPNITNNIADFCDNLRHIPRHGLANSSINNGKERKSTSMPGRSEDTRQGFVMNIPVMDAYADVDYFTERLGF